MKAETNNKYKADSTKNSDTTMYIPNKKTNKLIFSKKVSNHKDTIDTSPEQQHYLKTAFKFIFFSFSTNFSSNKKPLVIKTTFIPFLDA